MKQMLMDTEVENMQHELEVQKNIMGRRGERDQRDNGKRVSRVDERTKSLGPESLVKPKQGNEIKPHLDTS